MDSKQLTILGFGVLGAGALLFIGSQDVTAGPGGAGDVTKKEALLGPGPITETVETTELPVKSPDIIYNIVFPDPDFPSVPLSLPNEPWWVSSIDPPATKKEATMSESFEIFQQAQTLRKEHAPGWGVFAPTLSGAKGLVSYQEQIGTTKKEEKSETPVYDPREFLTKIKIGG